MKPTVHYIGVPVIIGDNAVLKPIDHPNHMVGHAVSNTKSVITSKIVSKDDFTGRIETQNTIYVPFVEGETK